MNAQGQVVQRLVIDTGVAQTITGDCRRIGPLLRHGGQVLIVGGVTQFSGIYLQQGEGKPVQVLAHQLRTVEPLGEQAAVVGSQQRQLWAQATHFQLTLRQPGLEGSHGLCVVVRGAFVATPRQQAGTTTVGGRIKLEAQHAGSVQAKADLAVGVARLQAQHEPLGPFTASRLRGAVTVKVAVEIKITQFQATAGAIDEAGLRVLTGAAKRPEHQRYSPGSNDHGCALFLLLFEDSAPIRFGGCARSASPPGRRSGSAGRWTTCPWSCYQ